MVMIKPDMINYGHEYFNMIIYEYFYPEKKFFKNNNGNSSVIKNLRRVTPHTHVRKATLNYSIETTSL